MALQRQNVSIPLSKGLDTKTDSKLVENNLLELENCVFDSVGELKSRYGLTSLSNAVLNEDSISSAKAATTFKSELNLISNNKLYSYSTSSAKWSNKGPLSGVSASSLGIVRNTKTQSIPDCASYGGITVYAYEDSSGGVRASVIDQNTDQIILNNAQISATGVKPRCTIGIGYIFIYYVESNTLKARRLVTTSPTSFESAISVVTDINTNARYDIERFGNNNVIAYRTTTPSLKVGYLKNTGGLASSTDGLPSPVTYAYDPEDCICIKPFFNNDVTNDGLYIAMSKNSGGTVGLQAIIYNTDLTNTPTLLTVDSSSIILRNITGVFVADNKIQWFYEVYDVTASKTYIKSATLTRSGVSAGVGVFLRSVGLISKAFKAIDNNYYMVVCHSSNLQSTYFTVKAVSTTEAFIVNRISYQNAGGLTAKQSSLCNVYNISTYNYILPTIIKTKLNSESGTVFSTNGIQRVILGFNNSELFKTAEIGNNLYIAAGLLFCYDGVNIFEQGFHVYPEGTSGTVDNASGNLVAGVRQWVIVYEWTDAQGQIHRSAPSIPLSLTTTEGTSNVTLTIPTLRLTERKGDRGEASIVVYRTEAAGNIFYRVSSITSPLLNDTTVDTVSYNDNTADSSIIGNELLYTTGGILENIPSPSCTQCFVYNNRLVIAGLEDVNLIWYSKQYSTGEAISFSDLIISRIDKGVTGITGIATLDEKIIFFKENSIFVQVANGPTDTGANSDIGIPQEVASDVGCISSKSIVLTPLGVMFKSKKGYYVIDRSLQISYIGAPVERYNSLTVSGAVLVGDANQVRFTHSDGNCLVYDYFVQQWGIFTNYTSISSLLWRNTYLIVRSAGIVDQENKNTFLDNSSNITTKLVTPWIQTAGIQGFQRIYQGIFLGALKSANIFRVRIGYDFKEDWHEAYNINSSVITGATYGDNSPYGIDVYGGIKDNIHQFKVNNSIQKCQAIRYEVTKLNPNLVDGEGFRITALTLNVGIKGGLNRVPKFKNM